MRILVCGGRNFTDKKKLNHHLDEAHQAGPITLLIHGRARGADMLADEWAARNQVDVLGFDADWGRYGNRAGPMRNTLMLGQGNPELVIAFKGGQGTRDMVTKARLHGVPVRVID